MSKKHPMRIRVDHNEFHFDASIANATEMKNQLAPLVEYALERAIPSFAAASAEAQQVVQQGITDFVETTREIRAKLDAETQMVERIAERVTQKLAALGEQDLERIACSMAAGAGAKMRAGRTGK